MNKKNNVDILAKAKNSNRKEFWIKLLILIIFLGALSLRCLNLFKYDLWFDELISDRFSFNTLHSLAKFYGKNTFFYFLKIIFTDTHSAFYYTIVYIYSLLFGGGKSLRILSVIFSMFSLGTFYYLARIFFTRRYSIFALFLMAVSPYQIWYAQEVRSYSMACFFSILLIYFYMQALMKNKVLYWCIFTLVSVMSLYASYYTIFLLFASGLILSFKDYRACFKKWLLSMIIVGLTFLPFILPFLMQLNIVINKFWLPSPSALLVLFTIAIYSFGYSANFFTFITGLFIFISVCLYGIYVSFKMDKKNTVIILLFSIFPLILTYIISLTVTSIYVQRQLIIFSPFYYLLITNGVGAIKSKRLRLVIIALIVFLLSMSVVNYYRNYMLSFDMKRANYYGGVHPKKNYSLMLNELRNNFKTNDIVAVTDIQASVIVSYYLKYYEDSALLGPIYFLFYPDYILNFTKLGMGFHEAKKDDFSKEYKDNGLYCRYYSRPEGSVLIERARLDEREFERLWLISSSWWKQGPGSINSAKVEKYISEKYKRSVEKSQDGISVMLFTKE